MKFLCGNCKAKYQLPDERVVGRTLRMTCRQCKAPILIRGEGATGSLPPPGTSLPAPTPLDALRASVPAPAGALRGSAAAPVPVEAIRLSAPAPLGGARSSVHAPAPLGSLRPASPVVTFTGDDAGERASVPGRAPLAGPPPLGALPLADAWHVGIQDVPVGPMSRDEVARKIALGAIGAESPAWREGMSDWTSIRHIPELAALLGSRMPPPPEAAKTPPLPVHSARLSQEIAAPAGAAAAPAWSAALAEPHAARGPSEVPTPPVPGPQGWGPMFAMAGGLAFLMTATAILGVKVLRDDPQPPPQPVVAAPATPPPVQPAQPPSPPAPAPSPASADLELDVPEEAPADSTPTPGAEAAAEGAPAKRPGGGSARPAGPPKQLTAEQREMLARMGGGLDTNPTLIDTPSASHGGGTSNAGTGSLSAAQISAVVLRGRERLQRCYETALRSVGGSQETVRMDVEVTIAPSGTVTLARALGTGLPGMNACLERTVRMWRFPASGETAETKFPVVFQPGG